MRNRQDESAQRKRVYPTDRADRHMTFRFDRVIDRVDAPALLAETEARIERMTALQAAAWEAHRDESDTYERRGCLYAFTGAGTEIDNLHKHLDRIKEMMG